MIATARSIHTAMKSQPQLAPDPDHQQSIDMPSLLDTLDQLAEMIAPVWPLSDYVAVNPFLGMAHQPFLTVRNELRQIRGGDILMPLAHYRHELQAGRILDSDISLAWDECQHEVKAICPGVTCAELQQTIHAAPAMHADGAGPSRQPDRTTFTWAEVADRYRGTSWSEMVTQEISRHCAAYYDQGQALWPHPWKHLPLFTAWREYSRWDHRPEILGLTSFRQFVESLPKAPAAAIQHLLTQCPATVSDPSDFLKCQLLSIAGWAAYAKYRDGEAARNTGLPPDNLIGLLAIRLCYDVAIAMQAPLAGAPAFDSLTSVARGRSSLLEVAARYLLLTASEVHYRRALGAQFQESPLPATFHFRKQAQMLFCIDVRSEPLRRHLESLSSGIETFGFAGFFGIPFEYIPLGMNSGSAQCPVLLNPTVSIREQVRGATKETQNLVTANRNRIRTWRGLWKYFQSASTSCFTFVESIGASYLTRLVTDSLRITSPVNSAKFDGVSQAHRHQFGPVIEADGRFGLSSSARLQFAESILRNIGLTTDFARLVVICGHASATVNNPYKGGLDCGACGGHSGESNARVAALLFNDSEVRAGLQQRGITIPSDTWFISALHNTTTDSLEFFDLDRLPATHRPDLEELTSLAVRAGDSVRIERAQRTLSSAHITGEQRSRDWSELRPEWGLAGNASFIIAPRQRTQHLHLSGRAFLHSYDFRQDTDGKILELIMTAPMVVASWINLQYYASSVDNRHFGSGNKAIHNVVGQFGVFEGNGGDLMTGLPWQSIYDGHQLQHEPLRLSVMIEAPRHAIDRIVHQHRSIRDLIDHAWISLSALEDGQVHRYQSGRGWSRLAS